VLFLLRSRLAFGARDVSRAVAACRGSMHATHDNSHAASPRASSPSWRTPRLLVACVYVSCVCASRRTLADPTTAVTNSCYSLYERITRAPVLLERKRERERGGRGGEHKRCSHMFRVVTRYAELLILSFRIRQTLE